MRKIPLAKLAFSPVGHAGKWKIANCIFLRQLTQTFAEKMPSYTQTFAEKKLVKKSQKELVRISLFIKFDSGIDEKF